MLFNGLSFLSKDAIRCESSLSMDLSNVLDCERGAESIKRDAFSNCKELLFNGVCMVFAIGNAIMCAEYVW